MNSTVKNSSGCRKLEAPPDAQIAAPTIGAVPAVTIARGPIAIDQPLWYIASEITPQASAKPAMASPAARCSWGDPGSRNMAAPTSPAVDHMPAEVRSASAPSSRGSSAFCDAIGDPPEDRPRSGGS
jgi:hypothetical protein